MSASRPQRNSVLRFPLWLLSAGLLLAVMGCAASLAPMPRGDDGGLRPRPVGRQAQAEQDLNQAVQSIASGDIAGAMDILPRTAATFDSVGDIERAAESRFWLGYCHEKKNQTAPAVEIYESLIRNYPASRSAEQAAKRLQYLKSSPSPGQ